MKQLFHLARLLLVISLGTFGAARMGASGTVDLNPSSNYVGADTCKPCHEREFSSQAKSEHAHALHPVSQHPMADSFFRQRHMTRAKKYDFDYTHAPLLVISDAKTSVEVPVEWAFGAGNQAVTFVSRVDKSLYLEHYFSYYKSMSGLSATPGQQPLQPAVLAEAAGLYYKTRDPNIGIEGCFQCHSTGPLRFDSENVIQPYELGVRCESCHGPGKLHVDAARRHNSHPELLIRVPSQLSAIEQLRLCGNCHRSPDTAEIDFTYPWNIRHEPPYLARSACFRKSNGALSCVTCHDPHTALGETTKASYNSQCVSCHRTQPGACKTDCVSCHMPRVSPQDGLTFTNHWIGIYSSGSNLFPTQR